MKKLFITMSALCALAFTSCTNENSVNTKEELGKATITGLVYAQLDITNTSIEKAPAGTKVVAIVDTKGLVITPANNANYAFKYYETTVDGTGKYSIEVEVGNRPIEVTIVPADFNADVKTGASTFEKLNFIGGTASDEVTVFKNGTFILDLAY